MQEAADQDVGLRPVILLVPQAFRGGRDAEAAALVRVEDRAEDAWGVETRQAQPIDRPVQPDQGGGPHVADDAVVLDRLVAPGSRPKATRRHFFRNGRSAPPQARTWSSRALTDFSWRGSGLKVVKFSKSVKRESAIWLRTVATWTSAITSRRCSTARTPPAPP